MKKVVFFIATAFFLVLASPPSLAQNSIDVHGAVKRTDGSGIINAVVSVVGTTPLSYALTDYYGDYCLFVPNWRKYHTLLAEKPGYESQEQPVADRVDFTLNSENNSNNYNDDPGFWDNLSHFVDGYTAAAIIIGTVWIIVTHTPPPVW